MKNIKFTDKILLPASGEGGRERESGIYSKSHKNIFFVIKLISIEIRETFVLTRNGIGN